MKNSYRFYIYNLVLFFIGFCLLGAVPVVLADENPEITSILPASGFCSGGAEITIKGQNFEDIEQVYFGNIAAEEVTVVDSRTITVLSSANWVGGQLVELENSVGSRFDSGIEFTYISSPLVSNLVNEADPDESQTIEQISIDGGEEIKIKGYGFTDGCKVVFNPSLIRLDSEAEGQETVIYIEGEDQVNIEDCTYSLESGSEGTAVTFIDSSTLTVETPAGQLFSGGVMVINPDNGASPVFEDIIYDLPELDISVEVTAEIVEDDEDEAAFIKVNWDRVDEALEYEVFVSVDGDDPEFLGSTQRTSFVYYEIEDDTEYEFMIKAMGEYSSSPLSEESNSVDTDDLADDDEDDGINEYTESFRSGDSALIKIGTRDFDDDGTTKIDLTRGDLAGSREALIIMPAKVVASSRAEDVEITAMDWMLRFNPNAFMLDSVYQNRKEADSGIRFRIRPYMGKLQRGVRMLSGTYLLEARIYNGKDIREVDYLAENIFFNLDYDYNKARMRRLENIDMYHYNQYSQEWESSYYWQNREDGGMMPINRLGIYTIMGNRAYQF